MIIRGRIIILAVVLVTTAVLGAFLTELTINADILSYLPDDDPVAELNTYISDRYGGSLIAAVAIESEDVFTGPVLRWIARLTEELRLVEGVQYVISLTNVLDIRKVEDWLEIGRLVDPYDIPGIPEELARLKRYTLGKEMYRGRLVSADGRVTVVMCRLEEEADKARIATEIRSIAEHGAGGESAAGGGTGGGEPPGKLYFAGLPFQLTEISRIVLEDIIRLIPICAAVILAALYISFRSVRGVVLPLLSAAISSVWALGIMSLLGYSFTVITNVIPVILIAVGSAYSIHVIGMFGETEGAGRGSRSRSALALRRIALPVALAAVTTVIGFIAFVFGSYLTMISEFGLFSSLGILFAFVLSVTFVPAVLSFLPPESSRKKTRRTHSESARRTGRGQERARQEHKHPRSGLSATSLMSRLGDFVIRRHRLLAAVGAVVFAAGLAGIPFIVHEVDFLSYFEPETEISLSEQMMREKFGGSTTLEILFRGDVKEPDVLLAMKDMESFLEGELGLHNVYSVVELIEEMSFAMIDTRAIPDTRAKVGNLWFLLEGEETLGQLVADDHSEAVIHATLESQNTREISHVVRSIGTYIDRTTRSDPGGPAMQLAGSAAVYDRVSEGIKRSQIQSLLIALTLVLLCNIVLTRRIAVGAIGMTPILFSLAVLFGVMGLGGIPLDVATALIGSISLGVGIDYSIHFLSRFRVELQERGDVKAAVTETLRTTGRAILINVSTVSLGLLTLLFGNLIPLRRFALLITVTMVSSGIGALTLLPSVIILTRSRLRGSLTVSHAAPSHAAPNDPENHSKGETP